MSCLGSIHESMRVSQKSSRYRSLIKTSQSPMEYRPMPTRYRPMPVRYRLVAYYYILDLHAVGSATHVA